MEGSDEPPGFKKIKTSTVSDMSHLLLEGYTMLADNCPKCQVALLQRGKGADKLCVACNSTFSATGNASNGTEDVAASGHGEPGSSTGEEVDMDMDGAMRATLRPLSAEQQEAREKSDNISDEISHKLLQGWTLMGDQCPRCVTTPLVRDRQKKMFCVACQLPVVREGAPTQKAADPQAPIPGLVALPEQPFETNQPGPSPTTSQTLPDDAGEREEHWLKLQQKLAQEEQQQHWRNLQENLLRENGSAPLTPEGSSGILSAGVSLDGTTPPNTPLHPSQSLHIRVKPLKIEPPPRPSIPHTWQPTPLPTIAQRDAALEGYPLPEAHHPLPVGHHQGQAGVSGSTPFSTYSPLKLGSRSSSGALPDVTIPEGPLPGVRLTDPVVMDEGINPHVSVSVPEGPLGGPGSPLVRGESEAQAVTRAAIATVVQKMREAQHLLAQTPVSQTETCRNLMALISAAGNTARSLQHNLG